MTKPDEEETSGPDTLAVAGITFSLLMAGILALALVANAGGDVTVEAPEGMDRIAYETLKDSCFYDLEVRVYNQDISAEEWLVRRKFCWTAVMGGSK